MNPRKVVAVIGASNNRRKFGNRAVRAYVEQGYTVIPINPHEREVEGLQAYASVLDVPGPIDMASFYVPPEIGERVIEEVARETDPGSLAEPRRRERRAHRPRAVPVDYSPSWRAALWRSGRTLTLCSQPAFLKYVHAKPSQAPGAGPDRQQPLPPPKRRRRRRRQSPPKRQTAAPAAGADRRA